MIPGRELESISSTSAAAWRHVSRNARRLRCPGSQVTHGPEPILGNP